MISFASIYRADRDIHFRSMGEKVRPRVRTEGFDWVLGGLGTEKGDTTLTCLRLARRVEGDSRTCVQKKEERWHASQVS